MNNKEFIFENNLSPEFISEEAFSSPLDDLIKSFKNARLNGKHNKVTKRTNLKRKKLKK